MEPGTLVFTEKTELNEEESRWLFEELWTPAHSLVNEFCVSCGVLEGECDNTTCIRTRVTNKLFLYESGKVPEYGSTL